eukprot:IDg3268t1
MLDIAAAREGFLDK